MSNAFSLGDSDKTLLSRHLLYFREEEVSAPDKSGDQDYPAHRCWSYPGKVGHVGGEEGQTVNINTDCMNMGSVLHLVMHSLGRL